MSITGALSSALSGLTAAGRASEAVSSNVANALNPNYARREVQLASRLVGDTGQGVTVTGIGRDVNAILLGDSRVAGARSSGAAEIAAFASRFETALGDPTDGASLTGRIGTLDRTLISAQSRPDDEVRLAAVANAARALTDSFGAVSASVQTARQQTDQRIGAQVDTLNSAIRQLSDLNGQIVAVTGNRRDSSALLDQRQALIGTIAAIVPVREIAQENGRVALYTTGGAPLLDGRGVTFGFTPTGTITEDMTLASGALSGLTMNGRPVSTAQGSILDGGSLVANFRVRDELAPAAQAQLDGLARDLVERFQDPAVDPTRPPGAPGLFTDAGLIATPATEAGLAGRLTLNIAVDPAQGGALFRLRDGLGATVPGPVGNSSLLGTLQSALNESRPQASLAFAPGNRSLTLLSGQVVSEAARGRLTAETEASYASARADALETLRLKDGVDTDREMQDLLQVENAYAANAKVIKTVDDLMQILLGL